MSSGTSRSLSGLDWFNRKLITASLIYILVHRSLKYIDLRLIDRGFVYRSSLELEFSAIACYIGSGSGSRSVDGSSESSGPTSADGKDESNTGSGTVCRTSHYSSNYPLPVILVSRSVFKAFQSDFYGYPKHLLLPTTPQTRWAGLGRPPVVTSNPRHQSLYYREWTEPKPKQVPGPQQDSANRQPVITLRSASGVVISPDIAGKFVSLATMSSTSADLERRQWSFGSPFFWNCNFLFAMWGCLSERYLFAGVKRGCNLTASSFRTLWVQTYPVKELFHFSFSSKQGVDVMLTVKKKRQ